MVQARTLLRQEVTEIMKKIMYFPLTVLMILGALAAPAYAQGWEEGPEGPRFYRSTGEVATNAWVKGPDGKERRVGRDGLIVTDDWVQDDGDWYYLDEDGLRLKETWADLLPPKGEEEENEKDRKYTYCFMISGKRYTNSWQEKDGKRYHFGSDGKLETGWILDNMYYTDEDGAALTGWQKLKGPVRKQQKQGFCAGRRGNLQSPQSERSQLLFLGGRRRTDRLGQYRGHGRP